MTVVATMRPSSPARWRIVIAAAAVIASAVADVSSGSAEAATIATHDRPEVPAHGALDTGSRPTSAEATAAALAQPDLELREQGEADLAKAFGNLSVHEIDAEPIDDDELLERFPVRLQESDVQWSGNDANPLCRSWALEGECIRNPQFMWVGCAHACNSLPYSDTDPDCDGWATAGECEKNPGFMLEKCNASCVDYARKAVGKSDNQARPNPHLFQGNDDQVAMGGASRIWTFLPTFIGIALLLIGGYGMVSALAPQIEAQQEQLEDHWARFKVRASRQYPKLGVLLNALTISKLGATFICLYYMNEAFTVMQTNPLFALYLPFSTDGVWHQHALPWVDATNLAGGVAAIICICGCRPVSCACVMFADTLVDSYLLLARIAVQFVYGRGLYINELMAKKFSLLGCVALMMASCLESKERAQSSFAGGLLAEATFSTRLSVALLLGRLLIAVLFLFVGLTELHRLLFQPFTPYLPGDGHDVVWPKAVELLLAVPFILGFRTQTVSRLLAASLLLEALYAWSWWRIPGDRDSFAHHRRAIHYREHFVTNVATAGGLLLLQKIGAGKYTVDELLKKTD